MAVMEGRIGKFFLIRHKNNPNLVLEVKRNSGGTDAHVILGEYHAYGVDTVDHQVWFYNRIQQTLCNKLTGYGLHCDDDQFMLVRPLANSSHQKWCYENRCIRMVSPPDHKTVGVADGLVCEGARCKASATQVSDCWEVEKQAPYYFYISSSTNQNLVVDVRGASRKAGAEVIVYENKGDFADNQLWYEAENSVIRSKLNGFALDSCGKVVVLMPYDASNSGQQWIIAHGEKLCNATNLSRVLSFKPGSLISVSHVIETTSTSADAGRQKWKFGYVQRQSQAFNHSGCGKYLTISCLLNGLVLQVEGRLIGAGSIVRLARFEKTSLRQHFYLDESSGTIRSALRNYCLDIDQENGLVINPFYPNKKTQQWVVDGKKIKNRIDGNLVIQVDGTPADVGSKVSMSGFTGEKEQLWEFNHVLARSFYIISKMNGKVLDVRGDEASAGASLIVYDRKSVPSPNQLWYEDEIGVLRSKLNGYVIDTTRGEGYLRPFDPQVKQQQWTIVGDRVQNKANGNMVLDIYGASSISTKVGEYVVKGTNNQKWKFELV